MVWWGRYEVVSKFWITSKGKAQADEKAQHIQLYVSILPKSATQPLGVRRGFETASRHPCCQVAQHAAAPSRPIGWRR
jgi:hypothetical protein